MKSKYKFVIFSIIFEIALGTILHFTYKWSNNNILVGTFSAVNESTWEHLKLAFFPMLISTIIGSRFINNNNYLCSRIIAIITSITFITTFFYTSNGALGFTNSISNILSFIVAIILGEITFIIASKHNISCNSTIAKIVLIILTLLFVIFTFYPPRIPLFKDPLTNTFGIRR